MNLAFDHLGVVATDPSRTIAFYVQLLEATTRSLGGHTVVCAGDVRLAIVPRGEGERVAPARGHHVAFRWPGEAREALLARLAALGAPHEEVRGRVYAADPDGLVLEFVLG